MVGAYVPAGVTTVMIPWTGVPGPGHFCLMARWVSSTDPMVGEGPDIGPNTRNNNNVAWRNVDSVNPTPGSGRSVRPFAIGNTLRAFGVDTDASGDPPPAGQLWRDGRDALGDLTEQVSPDTGTTTQTYDSGGNLVEMIAGDQQLVGYDYTPAGHAVRESGPFGAVDFNLSHSGERALVAVAFSLVFVRDWQTNMLERVSVTSSGGQADPVVADRQAHPALRVAEEPHLDRPALVEAEPARRLRLGIEGGVGGAIGSAAANRRVDGVDPTNGGVRIGQGAEHVGRHFAAFGEISLTDFGHQHEERHQALLHGG